jgi:DNA polymerase III subunit alpha
VHKFCAEKEIPTGPGRGSAAGSLVLYLIEVTNIDPVKYDLYFERFVSKSRARKIEGKDGVTYLDGGLLADIDNDISYEKRQEVVSFIEHRYPARTCNILTLNTLSSKLCIKECGKIVGNYSEQDVNVVSDYVPKKFGKVASLSEANEESEKLKAWTDENPRVFKIAKKLEGLNKNTGVHPSGIAISYEKLEDICPLQSTNDGGLVSGYDMNWVAELMVKFDILGLRTLSVIYDVCHGLNLDVDSISVDNKEIFKPLKDGLRCPHGLFQIEADTNFKVCRKVKPDSIERLSAVVAIGRPGALDFMDSFVQFAQTGESQSIHPFFDEVLSYTGGIPLYQEQLMKMAVKVGFTLDEAEQLRRIVGKKKVEEMSTWKSKIEQKIIENELPHEVGEVLWKVAEDSANYSFNKSHSISYATLAAWTTHLKFKYPLQFFQSLLKMTKFEPSPYDEICKISQELPYFNIRLLPPDLIKSDMDFTIEGENIRYGLNSIKGISEKSLQNLKDFRDSDRSNKYDIFLTAKTAGLNIGTLSALIQAGAMSSCSQGSRSLLVLEAQAFNILTDREKRNFVEMGEKNNYQLLDCIAQTQRSEMLGDDGKKLMPERRFQTFKKKYDSYKKIYLQNKSHEDFANWYFERKLLGYSYTYKLTEVFRDADVNNLLYATEMEERDSNRFIGVIQDIIKRRSRNGNDYIKFTVADETATIDALLLNGRSQTNGRWQQNNRVDKFLEKNKMPKKDGIVVFSARKGDEVLFIDNISVIDEKIYMKLGDVK